MVACKIGQVQVAHKIGQAQGSPIKSGRHKSPIKSGRHKTCPYEMNFSTSSFVGIDGCAPNFVVANAPQAHP